MSRIIIKPIIGQEVICPDGLGRVIDFDCTFPFEFIQVATYSNNRECKWAPSNVTLIPLRVTEKERVSNA